MEGPENSFADDPWITDEIRRAVRRRQRKFKKWNSSEKWRTAKAETDAMIKETKQKFFTEAVEKLRAEGSSQLP